MKIDAHQHFWHFNPTDYGWIDDSMTTIQRDFLPADLEPILQQNGFDGCVLVQVNQSEEENQNFLKFAELYDFIRGVVGWIDLKSDSVSARLAYYKNQPKMKGFRHIVQAEPVGFMENEDFRRGIKALANYDFTYDILIFPQHLKDALSLVRACENNKFVIDHLAKPHIREQKITQWSNYINQIAQYENVYAKVSGLVTEADWQHWKKEDFYIYLDFVLEAFGTDRLIYGSDWPVCLVAATYAQQLEIIESYFSKLSSTEKQKIFGLNAIKFYNLD